MIRNERRGPAPILLTLLSVLVVGGTAGRSQAAAPIDAFLCAAAKRTPGSERPAAVTGVGVKDQFSSATATVKTVNRLCTPAGLSGVPGDGTTHLLRHATRSTARLAKIKHVAIDNALGAHELDLGRPSFLLAPSDVDGTTTPPVPDFAGNAVDRYQCYSARASRPGGFAAAGTTLQVTDASGTTRSVEVSRPSHLCTAAGIDGVAQKNAGWHLACYSVRPSPLARLRGLHVDSGFGAATLDTSTPREICLPSRAVHACNGAPELCDRRFDEVSYATTHNSMSNADDGFTGPNQQFSVKHQMEDGVRAFMLDTHYDGPLVALCHAYCILGERPLLDTLVEMREFLEQNPYEVLSIIFESYVSAGDTQDVFAAAGLLPYTHVQDAAAPWPTLREMIAADKRMVVFTDSGGGTYPWYHHVWNYAFETNYSFGTPADLSCTPNRGNPSNRLFILNHFLTQVFGSPALAEQINHNPLFIDRARQCAAADASLPNFVTVDYYSIGDVLAVVDELNGL